MRRNIKWIIIAAIVGSAWLWMASAVLFGQPPCHPADAYATDVRYEPAGENTAVKLQVWCPGGSAEWYVSFFVGDQPTLRQWAEIQNTASALLRGAS